MWQGDLLGEGINMNVGTKAEKQRNNWEMEISQETWYDIWYKEWWETEKDINGTRIHIDRKS